MLDTNSFKQNLGLDKENTGIQELYLITFLLKCGFR